MSKKPISLTYVNNGKTISIRKDSTVFPLNDLYNFFQQIVITEYGEDTWNEFIEDNWRELVNTNKIQLLV
jgi:hypothetical protein